MAQSMTGFASASGGEGAYVWTWDLRSVNARGLDLRLRVPDWLPGLEQNLRQQIAKTFSRGAITVSLRITRDDAEAQFASNPAQLSHLLEAVANITDQAASAGVLLTPPTAVDLLAFRGVTGDDTGRTGQEGRIAAKLAQDVQGPIQALARMRAEEGAALTAVLSRQLDDIDALLAQTPAAAQERQAQVREALARNLAQILENAEGLDPARIAQELALLAVKSDVTEELDRLTAHVAAARTLMQAEGPIGRKLDFLIQEFNREANTLCSKSGSTRLTGIGLDLKSLIDQMREQVQNLE